MTGLVKVKDFNVTVPWVYMLTWQHLGEDDTAGKAQVGGGGHAFLSKKNLVL